MNYFQFVPKELIINLSGKIITESLLIISENLLSDEDYNLIISIKFPKLYKHSKYLKNVYEYKSYKDMLENFGYYEKYADLYGEEFDIIYHYYIEYLKGNLNLNTMPALFDLIRNLDDKILIKAIAFRDTQKSFKDVYIHEDVKIQYLSTMAFDESLSIMALLNEDYDIWRLMLIEERTVATFVDNLIMSIWDYQQAPDVYQYNILLNICKEIVRYNQFIFELNTYPYNKIGVQLIQMISWLAQKEEKSIPFLNLLKILIETYCITDEHVYITNVYMLNEMATRGNIDTCKLLLSFNFIEPDYSGGMALRIASTNNNFTVVKLLINDPRFKYNIIK